MSKPLFSALWSAYPTGTPQQVLHLIDGKVEENSFSNTCAVRVCRALNYAGAPIVRARAAASVSGADGKWYIFRVRDMAAYLRLTFGPPDFTVTPAQANQLNGHQGIIVFEISGWSDATGHATLLDAAGKYADKGYFDRATRASLWEMP